METEALYMRWKDNSKRTRRTKLLRPPSSTNTSPAIVYSPNTQNLYATDNISSPSIVEMAMQSEAETIRSTVQYMKKKASATIRKDHNTQSFTRERKAERKNSWDEAHTSDSENDSDGESDDTDSASSSDDDDDDDDDDRMGTLSEDENEGTDGDSEINETPTHNDNGFNTPRSTTTAKYRKLDEMIMSSKKEQGQTSETSTRQKNNDKSNNEKVSKAHLAHRKRKARRSSLRDSEYADIETEPYMVITMLVVWSLIMFYLLRVSGKY